MMTRWSWVHVGVDGQLISVLRLDAGDLVVLEEAALC